MHAPGQEPERDGDDGGKTDRRPTHAGHQTHPPTHTVTLKKRVFAMVFASFSRYDMRIPSETCLVVVGVVGAPGWPAKS